MLTYHNDPATKTKYQQRMEAHIAADNLRQGDFKRCAIACTLDRYSHAGMADKLGWPLWLVHWYEALFEGLPAADGPAFCTSILATIPVGASEEETERWRHAIAVKRLKRLLGTQQPNEAREAIEQVIAYHADPDRTEEMRLAALSVALSAVEAARSASESPAKLSAFLAAESAAESTAKLAWSVAESAKSAARSAVLPRKDAKLAKSAEYHAQWRDFLEVVAQPE